jgi:hypothetical protein
VDFNPLATAVGFSNEPPISNTWFIRIVARYHDVSRIAHGIEFEVRSRGKLDANRS